MAYRQHKQIQGGGAVAASRYANAAVAQLADEDLAGVAIDAFSTLPQQMQWTAALLQH
jgi:hypothetical protein